MYLQPRGTGGCGTWLGACGSAKTIWRLLTCWAEPAIGACRSSFEFNIVLILYISSTSPIGVVWLAASTLCPLFSATKTYGQIATSPHILLAFCNQSCIEPEISTQLLGEMIIGWETSS